MCGEGHKSCCGLVASSFSWMCYYHKQTPVPTFSQHNTKYHFKLLHCHLSAQKANFVNFPGISVEWIVLSGAASEESFAQKVRLVICLVARFMKPFGWLSPMLGKYAQLLSQPSIRGNWIFHEDRWRCTGWPLKCFWYWLQEGFSSPHCSTSSPFFSPDTEKLYLIIAQFDNGLETPWKTDNAYRLISVSLMRWNGSEVGFIDIIHWFGHRRAKLQKLF